MPETDRFHDFLRREWEWRLQEDPLFASRIGDMRYADRLPDYSLEGEIRRRQHQRESLTELEFIQKEALEPEDRLNLDLCHHSLSIAVEGHSFPDYLLPINQLQGIQERLPQLPLYTPFRAAQDYEVYLQRLRGIGNAVGQTIDVLKEGLRQQITQPRIPVREVEKQLQLLAQASAEESSFYEPFRNMPAFISDSQQQELRRSARSVIRSIAIPAFAQLFDFWRMEYYPRTRESISISALPKGRDWYEFNVRRETTTGLSAEEIRQIGLNEVQRIRSEMNRILKQTGYEGNYDGFLRFLRTDPQFFYTRADDLLAGYRDICKRIDAELPRLFGKLPRLPYGVREVPDYIAPSMTTGYYELGSQEAARPGWYFANTCKLETRPKWEMEVLSLHEAVPGHHLQLALAQEMEDVPEFRKHLGYNAYVEGWGLYSESLGEELGLYRDAYSKFGQLTYEMWRAIRLVVDTGMHAFGWSREQAIDYFQSNAAKQEHDIIVEIDRYVVWPGQALAYKIGELKIRELKHAAETKLGSRFDIRDFHDRILQNGALPLTILESLIRASE